MKMDRVEVKNKLRGIIRYMILSDSETDMEIPDAMARQILQNYGFAFGEKPNGQHNLDAFLKNLQKWIENNHPVADSNVKEAERLHFDLNLYEQLVHAETEYFEVMSELTKVLEEVVKHKETSSEYFKKECHAQNNDIEVLGKKSQFLKLQFFLKLYGEENALKGHLALRVKLQEELDSLRKKHIEVLEYNKQMNEIKNDKTFSDLFKVYKELRRMEEMTKIIGAM